MILKLKEHLTQLNDIIKEIEELREKIKKIEPKANQIVNDSVQSTTLHFPFKQTHIKIKGLDVVANNKLEEYKTILEDRYKKLIVIQTQTERFINSLPTSRLRRIFTFRYIEQLSWNQVASRIGRDATADSVRLEHDRYLKK